MSFRRPKNSLCVGDSSGSIIRGAKRLLAERFRVAKKRNGRAHDALLGKWFKFGVIISNLRSTKLNSFAVWPAANCIIEVVRARYAVVH